MREKTRLPTAALYTPEKRQSAEAGNRSSPSLSRVVQISLPEFLDIDTRPRRMPLGLQRSGLLSDIEWRCWQKKQEGGGGESSSRLQNHIVLFHLAKTEPLRPTAYVAVPMTWRNCMYAGIFSAYLLPSTQNLYTCRSDNYFVARSTLISECSERRPTRTHRLHSGLYPVPPRQHS